MFSGETLRLQVTYPVVMLVMAHELLMETSTPVSII